MATTQDRAISGVEGEDSSRPSFVIRPAGDMDLNDISAIESKAFSNPWHPSTFSSLLSRERVRVLVAASQESGVLGYAVLWWVLEQAELANLAVRGDCRRMGIGGALLDRVLEDAAALGMESVFLEVRRSNESAQALYATRGFRQISIRRDYYQAPREDALILLKSLGQGGRQE
jgi:ribosomal-protein-alanine N-acetyltransferase